jgi:hypothetical protein
MGYDGGQWELMGLNVMFVGYSALFRPFFPGRKTQQKVQFQYVFAFLPMKTQI